MTHNLPIIVRIGRPPISTFDPPRCGMSHREAVGVVVGMAALVLSTMALIAVLGFGPEILAGVHDALRGM